MSNIPIPKHLQLRPTWRGLPIPFIAVMKADGTPDFRVTDENARHRVMNNRWCQLCGQRLGRWVFFTGGLEAAKANAYFEPACHLDCLLYAMRVCPFIVGRIDHDDTDKIAKANPDLTLLVDPTFAATRNPLWVIKKADSWTYVKTEAGTVLIAPYEVLATVPLHCETMTAQDWARVREQLL